MMVKDFVQGNVLPLQREINQMTMDMGDLRVRHEKLVHDHKALQAKYDLLESRATALIWFVPGDVRIAEIQQMREHFKALIEETRYRVGERVTAQVSKPPLSRETEDLLRVDRRTLDDGSMTGP
jgi:hypothetical protein